MTKASDNAFPSLLITEGTEPSAPAAGKQRIYIDSTTHHLSATNSSGTERDLETAGAPAESAVTFTDITTNNSSTSKHGYLKKLSNVSTEYMSGTGVWSTPSGGTALVGSRVIRTAGDLASKNSTTFATLDATLTLTVTTGAHSVLVGIMCTATIDTAPQSICLDVDLDGARLGQTFGLVASDVNHNSKAVNLSFTHMTAALTAASHTFLVKYRVTGANGTFYASTGVTPFEFWVQEMPF